MLSILFVVYVVGIFVFALLFGEEAARSKAKSKGTAYTDNMWNEIWEGILWPWNVICVVFHLRALARVGKGKR